MVRPDDRWPLDRLRQRVGAPGIAAVDAWNDGTVRPFGLKVTLASGAQVWPAITAVAAPGENYDQPETPVTGEPPAQLPAPALDGKVPMTAVEQLLASALAASGNGHHTSAPAAAVTRGGPARGRPRWSPYWW